MRRALARVLLLAQVTRLVLDGPPSWAPLPEGGMREADAKELAGAVRGSALTTAEVRALCEDLQV